MGAKALPAFRGSAVNGTGTRVANARVVGTTAAVDTTKEDRDNYTLVPYGNQLIPLKVAIAMGIMERDAAGALTERNGRGGAAW